MSRPVGTAAELERRRQRAVAAVRAGEQPAAVARILGVGRGTVSRWLKDAQRPGGLDPKPHGHPPPKLTPAQDQQLLALLRHGADAHRWPNPLPTPAPL